MAGFVNTITTVRSWLYPQQIEAGPARQSEEEHQMHSIRKVDGVVTRGFTSVGRQQLDSIDASDDQSDSEEASRLRPYSAPAPALLPITPAAGGGAVVDQNPDDADWVYIARTPQEKEIERRQLATGNI